MIGNEVGIEERLPRIVAVREVPVLDVAVTMFRAWECEPVMVLLCTTTVTLEVVGPTSMSKPALLFVNVLF